MKVSSVRIGSLCDITSSKRIFAHEYQNYGVPFYRGKEIIERFSGAEDVSTEIFITRNKFEEIADKFGAPSEGDLLLTSVGTLGIPYLVKQGEEFYFKDGNLTWFRAFRDFNSRYLYYWLQSPAGRAQLGKSTIGTSQAAYTIALLKEMKIELPQKDIQDRISETLYTYDTLIENNNRRIKRLEESARLLYQEWFVRLRFPGYEHTRIVEGVPEGWKPRTLGDLCFEVREIVNPSELEPDTPYIGLEHIPRRSICLDTWGRAEEVTSTKHKYITGDILFGKIRPYFHKVGIAFTDGIASSDAIVMRPITENLRSILLLTVSSDGFVAVASKTAREGSKMPRADWNLMKQYHVSIPPEGMLDAFNGTIGPIVEQLKLLAFQNQKLKSARDLLLPRLMSGEIAV